MDRWTVGCSMAQRCVASLVGGFIGGSPFFFFFFLF
jgi:hypothetical protein